MLDKKFETKSGKEVLCEIMILPFLRSEIIDALLFHLVFYVSFEKILLIYVKYVGIFRN